MWLLIALVAQLINGSVVVFDKLLLKRSYSNPIGYSFWLGLLGLVSFAVLWPFGIHFIFGNRLFIALLAGAASILAMLFYFFALFKGKASNVVIFIGALSPIFTLIFSIWILDSKLVLYQFIAFSLLVIGGIFLFFAQREKIRFYVTAIALIASAFFGISFVLIKIVFLSANFATGFLWIKVGAALTVLLFLAIPKMRKEITHPSKSHGSHNSLAYLANRGLAGLGSILFAYAILLGIPSLVGATYGVQFIFAAFGGWLILKERYRGFARTGKIIATVFIILGILWLAVGDYLATTRPDPNRSIQWGVTFSQKASYSLGLNWRENYRAILQDLGVRRLRLVAYWDIIESKNNEYDFEALDYQMRLANQYGARVILSIGQKVPRWPECHDPTWTSSLNDKRRAEELISFMNTVIQRYRAHPALVMWQVENEPFLPFGECPRFDKNLLDREISLVKSLDNKHKVLMTDSGEIGRWYRAAKKGDLFGTTMYRRVYNRLLGSIDYHLPPEFFRLKEKITRFLIRDYEKKFIVVELAAEPWMNRAIVDTTPTEQFEFFDLAFFQDTIRYAKDTGFDEYYLWGAEWWYWLKEKHNYPEFWNASKQLFERHAR